jgi:hypothetical protein
MYEFSPPENSSEAVLREIICGERLIESLRVLVIPLVNLRFRSLSEESDKGESH